MLFRILKFFFGISKSIFYLLVPKETRIHIKEGTKDGVNTAGRAGFLLSEKFIVPIAGFFFICLACLSTLLFHAIYKRKGKEFSQKLIESFQFIVSGMGLL